MCGGTCIRVTSSASTCSTRLDGDGRPTAAELAESAASTGRPTPPPRWRVRNPALRSRVHLTHSTGPGFFAHGPAPRGLNSLCGGSPSRASRQPSRASLIAVVRSLPAAGGAACPRDRRATAGDALSVRRPSRHYRAFDGPPCPSYCHGRPGHTGQRVGDGLVPPPDRTRGPPPHGAGPADYMFS